MGIAVAMVVLLLDRADPDVVVSAASAARLTALGITSVSIVSDDAGVGVVLEGWAFDPASATQAAEALGAAGTVRALRPSVQVSVGRPR